jgi:hypothetical protein
MRLVVGGNSITLGAPIGNDHEAARAWALDQIRSDNALFKAMELLPAQSALLLLRSCALPRVNYLTRALPPGITRPAMEVFDAFVEETSLKIMGLDHQLSPAAQKQLRLPTRLGGFALRSLVDISNAAFWGAASAAAPRTHMVAELAATHATLIGLGMVETENLFGSTFRDFTSLLEAEVPPRTKVQHKLSRTTPRVSWSASYPMKTHAACVLCPGQALQRGYTLYPPTNACT